MRKSCTNTKWKWEWKWKKNIFEMTAPLIAIQSSGHQIILLPTFSRREKKSIFKSNPSILIQCCKIRMMWHLTWTYLWFAVWSWTFTFFGKPHRALFRWQLYLSRKSITQNILNCIKQTDHPGKSGGSKNEQTCTHRKKLSRQIVTQTNQMTSNAFITYNFQIDGFLNG